MIYGGIMQIKLDIILKLENILQNIKPFYSTKMDEIVVNQYEKAIKNKIY